MPLLFGLGMWLHSQWTVRPIEPFMQFVTWLTYSVAPIGIFSLCLFAYNLCMAPLRIERERHAATKALIPEEYTEKLSPTRPSEDKVLGGVLNRRSYFTLWEAASLMADNKLTGELSTAGNALLSELRVMLRDGKLTRIDQPTRMEGMANLQRNLGRIVLGDEPIGIVWSSAKITRKELFEISVELDLPIPSLEP